MDRPPNAVNVLSRLEVYHVHCVFAIWDDPEPAIFAILPVLSGSGLFCGILFTLLTARRKIGGRGRYSPGGVKRKEWIGDTKKNRMAHLYTVSALLSRMCALRNGGQRHPNAASSLHRSAMTRA